MITFGGDYINNNSFIKVKVEPKIFDAFKKVLSEHKLTQQEFFENKMKEYILDNLSLFIDDKGDK